MTLKRGLVHCLEVPIRNKGLRLPNKREIAVEGKETDGKKFFSRIRDMNRGAVLKRQGGGCVVGKFKRPHR